MSTRLEQISAYMAGRSAEYRNSWVGVTVVYTTPNGKRMKGTIAGWAENLPVVIADNSTVARLKREIEILP